MLNPIALGTFANMHESRIAISGSSKVGIFAMNAVLIESFEVLKKHSQEEALKRIVGGISDSVESHIPVMCFYNHSNG